MMGNNCVFLFFCCLFCHIVDDYYLQGILAQLKCRDWWEKNYPDEMYAYDHIVALLMHGFSWACVVSIPVLLLCKPPLNMLCVWIFVNAVLHAAMDDCKANLRIANLWQDQLFHIAQILFLVIVFGGLE